MLKDLISLVSIGTLLTTAAIAQHQLLEISAGSGMSEARSCVAPITNNKIGNTKLGTDVCKDGSTSSPDDKADEVASIGASVNTNGSASPGPESNVACEWYILDAYSARTRWGSNVPSEGHLEGLKCYPREVDTTRAEGGGGSALITSRFVPNAGPAQPAPLPPPDPAVLAERAYGELEIPQPAIGAGPGRDNLAVNLWTWLWVDNPGPLANTVAAGGVSVTATAALSSVTWSLGEPVATGAEFTPGVPATITCTGAGTPPPVSYDWKAEPPCGYMFHWRSLKERTGGTGTWPITATATWNVTWQSNTGATGATTLNASSTDQFDIGEYRIVLVQNPGG
jgi:hypothetical protein